jgi:hypothetical protein
MERKILKSKTAGFLSVVVFMIVFVIFPAVNSHAENMDGPGTVSGNPAIISEPSPGGDDENIEGLLDEATPGEPALSTRVDDGRGLPFRYEGELTAGLWATKGDGDTIRTTDRLDVHAWKDAGPFSLSGRFKLGYQDLEKDDKTRIDLREMVASYRLETGESASEIFVGKKIVNWGKGDEIRPLDRVSPQDLTSLFYYDLADRKTGRTGIFANLDSGRGIRFEGFFLPSFEKSETPGPGDYFEPAKLRAIREHGIAVENGDHPDHWNKDGGLGGRLMLSAFKTDMAFYAFSGYDPNPSYIVNRVGLDPVYGMPVVPLSVAPSFARITLFGADFERTAGDFVLRGEAAYQTNGALMPVSWQSDLTLLLRHPQGVVEKDRVQYVLGLDRNDLFIRNLFFNVQFFGEKIFDPIPEMTDPDSKTGMTAFFKYSMLDSKIEVKYRAILVFKESDQRHHIEISYKPFDWTQVSLGGVLFDGDDGMADFGQYSERSYVYGKVKLIF